MSNNDRKVNSPDPMQLPNDPRELTTITLDSTRSIAERSAAIDALIAEAPEAAKLVMLSLAERTVEPREILEAAGIGLARIAHGGVTVSEFDIRDMSEIAAIAYFVWRPPD